MEKIDTSKIRGFGKKQLFVPYLDKVFQTFDEEFTFTFEPKIGDTAWHPSGDCTPSTTELYNKAVQTMHDIIEDEVDDKPEQLSESLRKSFMVGHFWHQLLQYITLEKLEFCNKNAIERSGKKIWEQEVCTDGRVQGVPFHWAAGSGDIAPLELPKGWIGIVDFKTMNSLTFNKDSMPFADKYECQINIYMDFFDLDKALIVGINKDTPHAFKEFQFERNQDLIDVIYAKWKYVSDCLKNDTQPDPNEQFELPLRGHIL